VGSDSETQALPTAVAKIACEKMDGNSQGMIRVTNRFPQNVIVFINFVALPDRCSG